MNHFHFSFVLVAFLAGCGGGVTAATDGSLDTGTAATDMGAPTDSGSTGTDSGSTGTDSGSIDAGLTGTDSGPVDAGVTSADTGPVGDGAVMCMAGVMCAGFPDIDPTLRGSTSSTAGGPMYANCVGLIHQVDCCGAQRIYGANHAARGTPPSGFCAAETACRSQYMSPASCSDNTITVDSGATTTNISQVRVACDPASPAGTCTCQTIVCMTDVCRAASVAIGSCGP